MNDFIVGRMGKPLLALLIFSIFVVAANVYLSLAVIGRQRQEIVSLEERTSSTGRVPAGVASLDAALKDAKDFIQRLPNHETLPKVLGEVFRLARKSGLGIASGDYMPETITDAVLSRYTVTFPIEGRYPEIKRFIYGLETTGYPLVIEEITFSRSRAGSAAIELKVRLSIYFV